MIGKCRRDQATEQIARDIAGDVGREGAGGVGSAALLAQVSERQGKGGRHAKALRDTKHRKHGQVRRDCQQRGRERQQGETNQDAKSPVDVLAEHGDDQSGDRHTHRGGIDRQADRSRGHVIRTTEGGKDSLGRKKVDHGEESRQSDDKRAQQDSGRLLLHVHPRRWQSGRCLSHDGPALDCGRRM